MSSDKAANRPRMWPTACRLPRAQATSRRSRNDEVSRACLLVRRLGSGRVFLHPASGKLVDRQLERSVRGAGVCRY